ncbi:MAG: DUF2235 domain-containing protein [Proteobacteria bacterium]|nr:DUF2235 domain-containing protein [Pseudomonadota bacterium]MBS0573724.1 DUF2235 domain-containing protein [Pseudomonadota bacterium]
MTAGLTERLIKLLRIGRRVEAHAPAPQPASLKVRAPTDHVILLDGTLGALDPEHQTNVGRIYHLLRAAPQSARLSIYYEAGVQWHVWRDTANVAMGRGINRQIRRAYGWLASHYRPGDRIFLFGYSRGAYAVRSLAGILDQVGLVRAEEATERNIMLAWRYYQTADHSAGRAQFARRFCHGTADVEMIGVFDTVKALGVRLPFLWMWTEPQHEFHSHALSHVVRHGFQALALDETRAAFDPILWDTADGGWQGRVEQVWFRGSHGDVGGQLSGFEVARPLSNIPLTWMLERAERFGLRLPDDWRSGLPCDASAAGIGTTRGWGKAFLLRARRPVGRDPSERIHASAQDTRRARFWLKRAPQLVPHS